MAVPAKIHFEGKQAPELILSQIGSRQMGTEWQAKGRAFFEGDNKDILLGMLPSLSQGIDLIYIDPPFGTGRAFSSIEADQAYSDELSGSAFLVFLWERLVLLRECLSERGSIYLHIDKKIGHYVKLLMDELFGEENFINDITRIKCNPKNFSRKAYGNYSDMILYYAKNRDRQIWNEIREPLEEEEIQQLFPKTDPNKGPYTTHPLHAPGETRQGDTGLSWKGMNPPPGRHWRYSREELDRLEEAGLIEWSASGNPRKIVYARGHQGKKVQDVWTFKDKGLSHVDYPTQKNHDLLRRIILNSSHPHSWVMDAFAGSGGTLWMAESLGRKWIGMDSSPLALRCIEDFVQKHQMEAAFQKVKAANKENM